MVITHNKSYSLTADLRCRNVGVPPEDSDGVGVRSERLTIAARGKAADALGRHRKMPWAQAVAGSNSVAPISTQLAHSERSRRVAPTLFCGPFSSGRCQFIPQTSGTLIAER